MNKSANLSSGPTGTVITYTFTIANTGNAAGDLTLTDALGNGPTAGLLYVSGSGAWSNGQGALTDASDGAEKSDGNGSSIDYQAPTEASKPGDVVVKLTGFNPGVTQTVTFKAKVAKSATVGKDMTTNSAAYTCQAGDGGKDCRTNEVSFEVQRAMSVVANGSTSSSANGSNEPLTVSEATAGSSVRWTDVVWNTGNDTETYQLTLSKDNFPAGTTLMLFQADGSTPLVQGVTPPIPAPGSAGICTAPLVKDAETNTCGYPIVVQAQLPMNASGDGPFQASYIAASTSDPSQTDEVLNLLDKLSVASFVLANDISAALRHGHAPDHADGHGRRQCHLPAVRQVQQRRHLRPVVLGRRLQRGHRAGRLARGIPLAHRRHLRRARRADHERPRQRNGRPVGHDHARRHADRLRRGVRA